MHRVGAGDKQQGLSFLGFLPVRFAVPIFVSAAIALACALPAVASATQTLTVEKNGTGTGKVTSSPAGISCGSTCSFAFAESTIVTLTGTPDSGSAAVVWSGCAAITLENKCKVTMSAAKTVKATFDIAQHQLKVTKAGTGTGTVKSTPAGIECGATCTTTFVEGTAATLTAVSGPNSAPVVWSGCAKIVEVSGEKQCEVSMTTNKAVTATFNLNQVELKVTKAGTGTGTVKSTPTGIECGGKCSAKFGEGSTVTLIGTLGLSTEPVQWTGCASVDGENKCLVTMSAAKAVTATFNHFQFPLSVTTVGPGTGKVTSSLAGIDCGATCSASFDQGSTVTLTSVSGVHTLPVVWTGCTSVNGENKCLVTMSAAKAVTATYKPEPGFFIYTVAVIKGGTGAGTVMSSVGGINCGATCSTEVVSEAKVTLTAIPAEGSVFSHWSGGSCAKSAPCEKTIKSSRTVKAVFTAVGLRTLAITMAGTGAGTVKNKLFGIACTTSCSPSIAAGKKLTLRAEPAAGSTFSGWSGVCSGTGTCKVQMNEARSVTATFAKIPTPPSPGVVAVAGVAQVKGGKASLKLTCSGGPCKGILKLRTRIKQGKETHSLMIGRGSFSLALGASTTLKVKLSGPAKLELAKGKTLKAKVSGAHVTTSTVKLKPAKK
jgi:hypothetical protein